MKIALSTLSLGRDFLRRLALRSLLGDNRRLPLTIAPRHSAVADGARRGAEDQSFVTSGETNAAAGGRAAKHSKVPPKIAFD
jgi:hypothetical protein